MKSKVLKSLLTLIILGGFLLLSIIFILPERETSKPEEKSVELKTRIMSQMGDEPTENLPIRTELFDEQTLPREEAFMEALHKMTHQKVYATPKWGVLEITEERLIEMLHVLNESRYDHKAFYLETLEMWLEGDFSNAVDVHNHIWKLQDGTIGRAERLLDPDEEAEYIAQYLR